MSKEYEALVRHYRGQLDKAHIAELAAYETHGRDVELVTDQNMDQAVEALMAERYLGFDTESKPNFKKGERSNAVAIFQICSARRCFIFMMRDISDVSGLAQIIEQPDIFKVGVGLQEDHNKLRRDFGFQAQSFVDLGTIFRRFGRKNTVGSKQLVALVLNQRLRKSKRATMSNWSVETLSPLQIEYASDDAFSSIDVYLSLRQQLSAHVSRLDRDVAGKLDLLPS